MLDEKCRLCGSEHLELRVVRNRTAIYCASCGKFNRWVTSTGEIKRLYSHLAEKGLIEHKGFKVFARFGDNVTIRCGECGCHLYATKAGEPEGQFDLINAAYCPQCGIEFIDEQKILKKEY